MKKVVTKSLNGKEYFGHPSGLYVLFFTEMWERFSYYGMRALLVLYMTQYLLVDPAKAADVFGYTALETFLKAVFGEMTVMQMSSQIYGLYTGFVYFTPFFGGILADKYLGQYRTVYLGGILMAIGHFLMASEQMFLLALLFLILGNGAFKPNISTQVGNLYPEGDPRRDGAFTIFYMGINLGAFFSPLVCGTLGQKVGWHWGFGAAGVGMLIGLLVYWLGSDLVPKDVRKEEERHEAKPLKKEEWNAVFALIFLCALNIVFWAIYEQQGNTMQIFADKRVNWEVLGWTIPSTWFQSFNPFMIFLFAPVLSGFWLTQNKKNKEPNSITKMGIGCVLLGLSFTVLIFVSATTSPEVKATILWLFASTFILTIGELYLSPIGLSLVTKIAPKSIISMMMGMWFLSSFFGNYLSGYIGTYYETLGEQKFFTLLLVLGVATGVIFFAIRNKLLNLIGRRNI